MSWPRREAASGGWVTDENAARGSLGAASPAVLLPGALSRVTGRRLDILLRLKAGDSNYDARGAG